MGFSGDSGPTLPSLQLIYGADRQMGICLLVFEASHGCSCQQVLGEIMIALQVNVLPLPALVEMREIYMCCCMQVIAPVCDNRIECPGSAT